MAIKTWSSTQKTIALSVGEAEYTALVKVATEAWGIRSLAKDLGWQLRIDIGVDSSTAKSVANRSGIGNIRHLETNFLWVRQAVKEKEFVLLNIGGDKNPSDVLTKPLSVHEMQDKLSIVGAALQARPRESRPRWADTEDHEEAECVLPSDLVFEGTGRRGGVGRSSSNEAAPLHGGSRL